MKNIEQKDIFRQRLLDWYEREKRDLPWRRTANPYYIWVSEVMLQQTRVDTVIPYYERFIEKFPTLTHLANAPEEQLLKMWEGLGYYSRARNLQSGVKEVLATYDGKIPQNREEISKLKGVGPYTAGAVLSIAFGVPEHAVDGNVMRVMSRLLVITDDISIAKTRKIFERAVMELIDKNNPSAFNQAVMELGATICTPNPSCLLCPVRDFCHAFNEGIQHQLPVKTKKTKMKTIPVAIFAIKNEEGHWIMTQRPSTGLLANLWEFPMVEYNELEEPIQIIESELKNPLKKLQQIVKFKHVFSHITWEITCYSAELFIENELPEGYLYCSPEKVESLPKPVPVSKIWNEIQQS